MDSDYRFPPADQWTTLPVAADMIGVYRKVAQELFLSEYATRLGVPGPTIIRAGNQMLVSKAAVSALASIPVGDDWPFDVLNVRLNAARTDGTGWHATMTAEEEAAVVCGPWQVRKPRGWIGVPFLATIGGYPITAGLITDVAMEGRLARFTIERGHPTVAYWREHRLSGQPGREVAHLSSPSWATMHH